MNDVEDEISRTCSFIRDSVLKTRSDGVVIALSGGLDSAVVAALSARALGKEHVHCCFLRYKSVSLAIDKRHTAMLCDTFGLTFEVNRYVVKASSGSNPSTPSHMTRRVSRTVNDFNVNNRFLNVFFGNIEALMRSRYLYKRAKEYNSLVLGALNRSEWLIGYFTQFEKTGVDLQPILHLYKIEIVEMAKALNIPEEIIARIPSSDLWYGKTNEGLTFQKLDKILIEVDAKGRDAHECRINDVTSGEVARCIEMMKKAKSKNKGVFPPSIDKRSYERCT